MQDVGELGGVTKYQFQIDDDKWTEWKNTVPRSKSLETRIIELIEADTEDRVIEPGAEGRDIQGGSDVTAEAPQEEPNTDIDRDHLRDELAGSGQQLERRVDEIVAMYEHLQELRTAEKDDLLEDVDVDATGYASAESVWSNMVKGRDTLKALPGVEPPSTGLTEWKYQRE